VGCVGWCGMGEVVVGQVNAFLQKSTPHSPSPSDL
jgi:hypothetical protein